MPPKFSLQNVLDVRHSKVEKYEIELSQLFNQQLKIEKRITDLETLKNNLMTRLSDQLQGEISLTTVRLLTDNIHEAGEWMDQAQVELYEDVQKVQRKRDELVLARQAEEVLEILKKKRIETFNSEQVQIEARVQDDIYISLAFQKS